MSKVLKYKKLPESFFKRPTIQVAKDLVGKLIIRRINKKTLIVRITETEAYVGERDLASHASRGKTARNSAMYQEGGVFYVYLVYGMHFMLNVVTEDKDFPSAVLVRAGEGVSGFKTKKNLSGPGILTKELKINKRFNGRKPGPEFFFAEDLNLVKFKIKKDKRVGVEYAGRSADFLWRFILQK